MQPPLKEEAGHPPKAAHPSDTRTSVKYKNEEVLILLHFSGNNPTKVLITRIFIHEGSPIRFSMMKYSSKYYLQGKLETAAGLDEIVEYF